MKTGEVDLPPGAAVGAPGPPSQGRPATGLDLRARLARGIRPLPLAMMSFAVLEPVVAFLDHNRSEYLQVGVLFQLVLATMATALVIYLVLLAVLPRAVPARIAASVAAFVFLFFQYGTIVGGTDHPALARLGAWAVVTLVAVAAAATWSRNVNVCLFLVLFLTVATLMPAASYASYQMAKGDAPHTVSRSAAPPIPVSAETVRTPDVWWLLLDEYGRADSLDTLLDLDNTTFLDELDERGFAVADDSYSSYPVTALSISSVLEMDYVATDSADLPDGAYGPTSAMRGKGRVVDALHEHGYRYLYADNGVFDWSTCDPAAVDVCIDAPRSGPSWGNLTRTVADLTPLAEIRSDARPDPASTVRRAQQQMRADEPEFVFAHVLNPHEPYWFEDDCSYRTSPVSSAFDPDRYAQQLTCLNPRILDAVDAITAADPDAIVMLQSDHGSGVLNKPRSPLEQWSDDALSERYSIFEALRFPEGCDTPHGDHANVATFEYVLACIEGRQARPIEDRYFFWQKNAPTEVIEIELPGPIEVGP